LREKNDFFSEIKKKKEEEEEEAGFRYLEDAKRMNEGPHRWMKPHHHGVGVSQNL
jgi:hypothetical protein